MLSFLDNFSKRMKHIALYAFLFKNSIAKTTWKQYGFEDFYEQTNVIFMVLLFIMEQSLKDESCTMDDIASFIDTVNMQSLKKHITYEECKELGDFIINIILGNEGKVMYFRGYDFHEEQYKSIHVSFIANKPVYIEEDVRRTSYYLTDDGYNLMLSTLEMESNMRLTVHEMIFKLHIEKASYDKAVDDVKNIFNQLRIQFQRIQEAMRKVKQNALSYSVLDYKVLLEENLSTIEDTSKKFSGYRENIREKVKQLELQDINIEKLGKEDLENLKNLKIIEGYLSRAIDEHQQILKSHFELKSLYSKELEDLSQMTLIKRFNIRNELYDKVLDNSDYMENIEYFIRPLLNQELDKTYNINKSIEIQKPITTKIINDEGEILSFDEDEWQEERIARQKAKLTLYNNSLKVILIKALEYGSISLRDLKEVLSEDYTELIPTIEIFKEIIVELLKNMVIDIEELRKEKSEHLFESSVLEFQLNESILELIHMIPLLDKINKLTIYRAEDKEPVIFENLNSDNGQAKKIYCSNILFNVE
ncbi:hypothetical protein [Tissierella creatinophila]|uniref:Uncharacterized protein n=1 Tax=Tissierella creatinophila DSM 6911 TaxID=1123403 RepID=A0A1U7M7P5_TISCR|nr:hypothetical protein [Tissierella creatinophila]OLS03306.1 hypothetical protein TICRE_06440 [Tissierella creatinophila DSM 6911]